MEKPAILRSRGCCGFAMVQFMAHLHRPSGTKTPIPLRRFQSRRIFTAPVPGNQNTFRDVGFWEKNAAGIPVEKKVRDLPPVAMVDIPGKPLKDWVRQYQQGVLAIDEGVGTTDKSS